LVLINKIYSQRLQFVIVTQYLPLQNKTHKILQYNP